MKYNPRPQRFYRWSAGGEVKRREYDENKQRNNPDVESFVSGNN